MKEEYLREVIRKERRPISNFFLHSKAVVLNHQPPECPRTHFPSCHSEDKVSFKQCFPQNLSLKKRKKINDESAQVQYFRHFPQENTSF